MPVLSLSSAAWHFRDAATQRWLPATVPGCVHTDLVAAKKIPDPFFGTNELGLQWIEERDWEYRGTFSVPPALLSDEVVELVADGLDTVATVTLNGTEVARTDNMFVGFRWPVKSRLRPGRNEIVVRFESAMKYVRANSSFTPPREINDPVGGCVRIRKQQCQFGWDWGPRFVTAGIWRDLRLESWTANRLEAVRVTQHHDSDGTVALSLAPETARPADGLTFHASLKLAGKEVAQAYFGRAEAGQRILSVKDPQRWWPAGQGAQPLYDLTVTALDAAGQARGSVHHRIGLRTIALDRSADQWGECFRFLVNGRPVFLKGANWIPAHSFVAGLTRRDYERDLRAAAAANMNCVRVWGGGIYEHEAFHDLCDELGLLVWQDFMFSCTLYPGDERFLANVRREADYQVRRLRHRASIALWCGNNEIPGLNPESAEGELKKGYEAVFHEVLPQAVQALDGVTPYWPSSPWRGRFERSHENGEKSGDTHFWDVWHARHPVKDYEKWSFRFVSEFGMQSYASPETNATFCPTHEGNVFGPAMENHQKNRAGNQIILDYVSRRYRFPRTQKDLIYLSQLNQAHCMQVGVEHYRRLMPRCMGAIYWQLNDCWPVASWSSIEFTGHWKALHFAARRFFAPALVTAHVPGDEKPTIGNYRETTVDEVHLYTVFDGPAPRSARLRWELWRLDGRRLAARSRAVKLVPGESVRHETVAVRPHMDKHGRDHLYVRLILESNGETLSEQSVFLTSPRFLALPAGAPRVTAKAVSPNEIDLTFVAPVFLHAVDCNVRGLHASLSDNFFDLYPKVPRTIRVTLPRPTSTKTLLARLRTHSLVDSFA
ncbi:MAG TPA: glycoside hydrolase family 2 protein [Candidatus Didemnitutus sp.]|nr:glycoside hydrolase family 2 protein [Candidatus Didemnitutus sp.]